MAEVESPRGAIRFADFEESPGRAGVPGGLQRVRNQAAGHARAAGGRSDGKVQDLHLVAGTASYDEADDARMEVGDEGKEFIGGRAPVLLRMKYVALRRTQQRPEVSDRPLGSFGRGLLDGKNGLEIGRHKRTDNHKPFQSNSASERRM